MYSPPHGDWDPFDNYELDPVNLSPRQVFEHWEAKFVSFLEANGYRTDYCTDTDIRRGAKHHGWISLSSGPEVA